MDDEIVVKWTITSESGQNTYKLMILAPDEATALARVAGFLDMMRSMGRGKRDRTPREGTEFSELVDVSWE